MELTQELINTLQGIHDGKPWQWGRNDEWYGEGGTAGEDHLPLLMLFNDYEIRLKPEPVRVPLGPEDVPPGSVLRHEQLRNPWSAVLWVDRLDLGTSEHEYTWQHAAEELEINRSLPLTGKWDANAWEPCWKEVQP